ncbi:MAG: hypothetical protein ACTHJQ_25520 [Rhizobiaceae bacterium]
MRNAVMLSEYPADKLILTCDKCGLLVQYDKAQMLAVGGDRKLPALREDIARKKGCQYIDSIYAFDGCKIRYANIVPAKNAYQKMKGG